MERIRPAVGYVLCHAASALGLWAAFSLPHRAPAPPPSGHRRRSQVVEPQKPQQRPQVDVVFVLDTTGSMSSLPSGAKRKSGSLPASSPKASLPPICGSVWSPTATSAMNT